MSDHVDQTVRAFVQKIEEHERSITKIKTTINQLLELDGRAPMFAETDLQTSTSALAFRKDAFFGKPLATCVKTILEARGAADQGAASADELYDALIAGGFDFEEKGESLSKRNLAISLGKNTAFQRTPNGLWGLREWYPAAKAKPRGGAIGSTGINSTAINASGPNGSNATGTDTTAGASDDLLK